MKHSRRRRERAPEVASATECTGIMPALPPDEASQEAEAALYDVHPAED